MSKKIIGFVIAVIIILAAGAGVWRWKEVQIKKQEEMKNQEEVKKEEETKEVDMSDWKTYRDEKYGFEIKYPKEWEIQETLPPGIGGEWLNIVIDKNRHDLSMSIARFELEKKISPKDWYMEQGFLGAALSKEYDINGYLAYYVEINNPQVYLLHKYFISNKNDLISFHFQEKYRKFNNETKQYDETSFSQYLPAFEAMVNSIKFMD